MRHLLIGGHGLVGAAVRAELTRRNAEFAYTDRQGRAPGIAFDLLAPETTLPSADILYLVAGMPGFVACEADRTAWRVNVDGVIRTAERVRHGNMVYVSSEAVETCGGTALGRQKAAVESYMRTVKAAIVRPGKITSETAPKFAQFMVDIGLKGIPGLYRWAA